MPQFNIRDLPEASARQIEALQQATGMTKTQLVIVAIDRMWREEVAKPEAEKDEGV